MPPNIIELGVPCFCFRKPGHFILLWSIFAVHLFQHGSWIGRCTWGLWTLPVSHWLSHGIRNSSQKCSQSWNKSKKGGSMPLLLLFCEYSKTAMWDKPSLLESDSDARHNWSLPCLLITCKIMCSPRPPLSLIRFTVTKSTQHWSRGRRRWYQWNWRRGNWGDSDLWNWIKL